MAAHVSLEHDTILAENTRVYLWPIKREQQFSIVHSAFVKIYELYYTDAIRYKQSLQMGMRKA